jgi:two-component system, NarL family, response regulator LiaR
MQKIRLIIADDHAVVREGVRTFLSTQEDIDVVGDAADGAKAAELCAQLKPDVALVDLVMAGVGGIEATKRILQVSPQTRVIVLTSFEDDRQILPAIQAGALSYLLKEISGAALVDAIRKAKEGEAVLHPRVAARLVKALKDPGQCMPEMVLSRRERDVLEQIAEGRSNVEIGEQLGIGEKTVKTHITNLLVKLGLRDRTQAAIFALKHGIVE